MPIYEYRCNKCSKELELMHKVSEPAPKLCPECNAEDSLERLVSRTSFHLKGGGWYSDLYGSAKPGASKDSKEAPASKEAAPASSSTSSESKPAATPAPSTGSSST